MKNNWINLMYTEMDGSPVERTRDEYRYSYDPYVLWRENYSKEKSEAVYSDRLMQWDYDKFNNCCQEVWNNQGQYFNNRDPKQIEKFLALYFNKEIKLTGIMEGCNASSGYPYWVFYYENL